MVADDDDTGGERGRPVDSLGESDDFAVGLQRVRPGTEGVGRFALAGVDAEGGQRIPDHPGHPVVALVDAPAAVGDGFGERERHRRPGVGHRAAADGAFEDCVPLLGGNLAGAVVPLGPPVATAERHLSVWGPDAQGWDATLADAGDHLAGALVVAFVVARPATEESHGRCRGRRGKDAPPTRQRFPGPGRVAGVTAAQSARIPWDSPVLRVALASTLVGVLGVTLVSPLLPAIAEQLRVSDGRASLVVTAYTLPGIALGPVAGALADRYGRRRVLAGSLVAYALCGVAVTAMAAFAPILLLRAGQGVAASAIFSLGVTLLSDAFEGPERAAALGVNAAAISVGAAVYPLLGGALGAAGWRRPFYLYAVGLPVALWATVRLADPPAATDRESGFSYIRNSVRALPRRATGAVFGAAFAAYVLLFGALFTAVPFLLGRSFDLPAVTIGLVLSVSALSTAAVALSNGRLAARFPPSRLVALGFCAYGVGLLAVWAAPGPAVVAVGALVVGAGQGTVLPSIDGLLSTLAPPRYRAGVFGLRTSVIASGATVGPVVFAVAGSRVGYGPALLTAGVTALLAGAVGFALVDGGDA